MSKKNTWGKYGLLKGERPDWNNPDHLAKLKAHQEYEADLLDDHIHFGSKQVDVDVRVKINFPCVDVSVKINFPCAECAHEINYLEDFDNVDNFEINEFTHEKQITCDQCKCIYEFYEGVITMIANPKYPHKVDRDLMPPE
jgi:hypothetical protein